MSALNVTSLQRVFKHGSKTLKDPDKSMSPVEVKKFYSGTYPELTTASVHGPSIVNEKAVYEFKASIGTKG